MPNFGTEFRDKIFKLWYSIDLMQWIQLKERERCKKKKKKSCGSPQISFSNRILPTLSPDTRTLDPLNHSRLRASLRVGSNKDPGSRTSPESDGPSKGVQSLFNGITPNLLEPNPISKKLPLPKTMNRQLSTAPPAKFILGQVFKRYARNAARIRLMELQNQEKIFKLSEVIKFRSTIDSLRKQTYFPIFAQALIR
jgi:hypothetical protein